MAIRFIGNGDNVANNSTTLTNGLSALSMVAWIKSDVTGTDKGWLIMGDPSDQDRLNSMRYDNIGAVTGNNNCLKGGILLSPGNIEHSAETIANIQTTNWQHCVFRWKSGTDINWIIDGVAVNDAGGITGGNTGTITGQTKIIVGLGPKDNSGSNSWNGIVGEIRVYNKYLSLSEAQTMHACPGTDGILDGLIYHYQFEEGGEGENVPATSGIIKGESANKVDLTRIVVGPTWDGSIIGSRAIR